MYFALNQEQICEQLHVTVSLLVCHDVYLFGVLAVVHKWFGWFCDEGSADVSAVLTKARAGHQHFRDTRPWCMHLVMGVEPL